ncbi:MAG: hypothetical protein K2W82_10485 [Candidatus Obscuribacterales bacterium]|nr:hypothetical protein [Candidatus Obscuribacterales bacterium]
MQSKLEEIFELAENAAASLASDLSVVDARITQQGKHRSLEITIHRPGGQIGLDDCESFSRVLEPLLESSESAMFNGSYLLEVQSPGLERVLKTERDFAAFVGEPVAVKTKELIEGLGYEFSGLLSGHKEGEIQISNPEVIKQQSSSKQKKTIKKETDTGIPQLISLELTKILQIRRQAIKPAQPTETDN